MDYEKKYKEALERARQFSEKPYLEDSAGIVEYIFPELKESEDERIKKWIIKQIKTYDPSNIREEALAWLEKQGEKESLDDITKEVTKEKDAAISFLKSCGIMNENGKLADEYKIEQGEQTSKHFELKSGHWYICHRAFCCRADHLTVKEGERFMCEKDGIVKGFVIKEPEKYFKEVCAPAPIEDERKPANKVEPKFKIGQIIKKEGFNLGFTIVKIEDGFYYNDEGDYFPFTDQDNWELVEQKPAWSEEDEDTINFLISHFCVAHSNRVFQFTSNKIITYDELLEKIRNLRPHSYWKPSDKQLCVLEFVADRIPDKQYETIVRELISDLKKL